jgi:hypothetical protein
MSGEGMIPADSAWQPYDVGRPEFRVEYLAVPRTLRATDLSGAHTAMFGSYREDGTLRTIRPRR